ncbi:hypothetical protein ES703_18496 [subsurface metagenome]|jgi:hypothetical protein
MVNNIRTVPEESTSKGKCCHYWIVESPDGPTSRGVCKFCGAEKEFDNYGPDSWSQWDRDTSTSAEFSRPGLPDLAHVGEQDNPRPH